MKLLSKIFWLLALMVISLNVAACGITSQSTTKDGQQIASDGLEDSKMNNDKQVLVAYFSCTGNTRQLAKTAAKALNADLYEIKPEQPYTGADLNYYDKNSRSTKEMKDEKARPAINGKIADFEQYKTIIVAYPIWWDKAPRILDTFMESYDFSSKTMAAIATSGGSGIGNSDKELAELGKNLANWKEGKVLAPDTSVDELKNWFTQNGILH